MRHRVHIEMNTNHYWLQSGGHVQPGHEQRWTVNGFKEEKHGLNISIYSLVVFRPVLVVVLAALK